MLTSQSIVKTATQFTLIALAFLSYTAGFVQAESIGKRGGRWPDSWPKELEPLRKRAWTWEQGKWQIPRYDISFATREEFESAWPHILKLQAKDTPIRLVNGPHVQAWATKPAKGRVAGVIIQPLLDGVKIKSATANQISLVVDGKIVDLNRIRLPADALLDDQRDLKPGG